MNPSRKYDAVEFQRRGYAMQRGDDAQSGKVVQWTGLEITGKVRCLAPELFEMRFLAHLDLRSNCLSHLPRAIGELENLTYLDCSHNCLEDLPKEIGELLKLRDLLLNHNKLRELPYELGRLYKLRKLSTDNNPFNHDYPRDIQQLLMFLLDNLQVPPIPPARKWTDLDPTPDAGYIGSGERFTVMTYNILCEKYATRQLYGYCPSWALLWSFRRDLILKELNLYSADIISLQEVEMEQLNSFFAPKLQGLGYEYVFSQKTRAKMLAESEKKYVDGCAIFFKRSRFRLINHHTMEFSHLAAVEREGALDMLNRVMPQDNIGIAVLLEVKGLTGQLRSAPSPPDILVSNAHVHWDPSLRDVKMIQTIMLMHELETIVEEAIKERQRNPALGVRQIPLLLCGDMNSLPDSGVVEYLLKGQVAKNHPDFQDKCYEGYLARLNSSRGTEAPSDTPPVVSHSFDLSSVFDKEHALDFTNHTRDFTGNIDYIFHTSGFLQNRSFLNGPEPDWLRDYKVMGFPHPHFPSDHIPLVAELELCMKANASSAPGAARPPSRSRPT